MALREGCSWTAGGLYSVCPNSQAFILGEEAVHVGDGTHSEPALERIHLFLLKCLYNAGHCLTALQILTHCAVVTTL